MDTEYTPGDGTAQLAGLLHADDAVRAVVMSATLADGQSRVDGHRERLHERLRRLLRQYDR